MDLLPLRTQRYSAGAHLFQHAHGDPAFFTGAGGYPRRAASACSTAGYARLAILPLCRMAMAAPSNPSGCGADLHALFCQFRHRAFSWWWTTGDHHRTGDLPGAELRLRPRPRCASGSGTDAVLSCAGPTESASEQSHSTGQSSDYRLARSTGQPAQPNRGCDVDRTGPAVASAAADGRYRRWR